MQKLLFAGCITILLTACGSGDKTLPADPYPPDNEQAAEPAKDAHGCIPSAGQLWSNLRNECLQILDVADIRMHDPADENLAVYILLAQDKSKAEVFAADLQDGVILNRVKGGYASKDGKVRLRKGKGKNNWKIKK